MEDQELPINFVFDLKDPKYKLVIRQYLFGQFRLQLTDGHPDLETTNILREACTYKRQVAVAIKSLLQVSDDPVVFMASLAKPFNCEKPGGRIRLDARPDKI